MVQINFNPSMAKGGGGGGGGTTPTGFFQFLREWEELYFKQKFWL